MSSDAGRYPYEQWFFILLAVNLAGRVLVHLATGYDLIADEAYYWDWSRHPDWSYFSKGPMIAYLIWIGRQIFGSVEIGIRAPGLLLSMMTLLFAYKLAEEVFRSCRTAFWTALTFSCVPIFNAGSMIMTIDNPLYCFWTMSLFFLWRAVDRGWKGYWILSGAAMGLGLMAKAVILFYIPTLLLFLALFSDGRRHLRSPWPWIAIVTGLLFFLPQLYWNAQNDFTMFRDFLRKAGVMDGPPPDPSEPSSFSLSIEYPIEFILSQAGIFSPVIFAAMVWAMWSCVREASRTKDRRSLFIFAGFAPVFFFYLLLSFNTKINANWAVIFALTPLIRGVHEWLALGDRWRQEAPARMKTWRRWTLAGLAVGFIPSYLMFFTGVLYAIGVPMPVDNDPTNRLYGWSQLGQRVSELRRERLHEGPLFLSAARYQVTAELAFYADGKPEVYCLRDNARENQYYFINDFSKVEGMNSIYVLRNLKYLEWGERAFEEIEKIETFEVFRYGQKVETFHIFYGRNFLGWEFDDE